MANIEAPEKLGELPLSVVKNMVTLATSGFGLVVALAWNEFIKNFVDTYINPYLGKEGSTASLFIYAVIMTLVAVLITMQLTGVQRKLEQINDMVSDGGKPKKPNTRQKKTL